MDTTSHRSDSDIKSTSSSGDEHVKKNEILNVEEICIEPGERYTNWKRETKVLLKKREHDLMSVRCGETKSAVNQGIQTFAQKNNLSLNITWDFDSDYNENTLRKLSNLIDTWRGVRISRLKSKKMSVFKKYFVIGKNWCDQNKKKVWAPYFWQKIFVQIKKFSHDVAQDHAANKCILKEKELAYCLELEIVNAIFNKTVQFTQTKKQPLIPNGTLKKCAEIKQYLLDLHATLSVDKWCTSQTTKQKEMDQINNENKKRTGNAKLLVQQLKDTLHELLTSSQQKLDDTRNAVDWCQDSIHCIHRTSHKTAPFDSMSNINYSAFDMDMDKMCGANSPEMEIFPDGNTYFDGETSSMFPPRTEIFEPFKPETPPLYEPYHEHPPYAHNVAPFAPFPPQIYAPSSYAPSHFAPQSVTAARYSPMAMVPFNPNTASNCCQCCQSHCSYAPVPHFYYDSNCNMFT